MIGALAVLHHLLEMPFSIVGQFVDLLADLVVERGGLEHLAEFVDESADSVEKLFTKFSGFLISWAMPAVSWPSEASFSVWTRRSARCANRRARRSFLVRACTSSNSRAFSIAMTA